MRLIINSTIIAFLLLFTAVQAQQKAMGFVALPDSDIIVLKSVRQIDSLKIRPQSILQLPAGKQRLKLIFLNDRSWNNWAVDTTLNVPAADTLFLHNVHRSQTPVIRFSTVTLTPGASGRTQFKHWLKPGLAVATVLSNWASFYLKRRADDYYRLYRHTSDLNKIQSYYAQTKNFDTFSNVMLSVSITSLGGFLYLLITSP